MIQTISRNKKHDLVDRNSSSDEIHSCEDKIDEILPNEEEKNENMHE
jgi:hypothetical protein